MDLQAVFGTDRPIVGMVHLPALPGAPEFNGDRGHIHERARSDAVALAEAGIDGLIVENFGDAPFYPDDVPGYVIAEFTAIARTVADAVDIPVGVNVLRNDAQAALAIAAAIDGAFIRVNVHSGARLTDQGLVEGRAHETLRLRERLQTDVAVWADIDVKHSSPVGPDDDRDRVAETVDRGLADAVIVSGRETGTAADEDAVADVAAAAGETPVFVGSGVTSESVDRYLEIADGVIVGTALKAAGTTANPVDPERVRQLVAAADR